MDQEKGLILIALPPERVSPETLEGIRKIGEGRETLVSSRSADTEKILRKVEIAFGDVPFSLIPRMPRLRWVQLWSAGADLLQGFPGVKNLPFTLTTTSGIHGQQIAEHLFGLILAWNRRLPQSFAARQRREWLRITLGLSVLSGKTMLILGYGSIGRRVAQAARGFGMELIGVRRHVPAGGEGELEGEGIRIEAVSKLSGLLPLADIVVNILPHTQDTAAFFGRAEFAAMKKSALYANVGRGVTTDEAALIEALNAGTIAGALLDVTREEPLPPDSPLWDMDRVILTAHYAGFRPGYDDLAAEIALENLGRYVRGEALKNVVDKQAGY
jgi:phosphoglycerate dehydrogenase-like enzyme